MKRRKERQRRADAARAREYIEQGIDGEGVPCHACGSWSVAIVDDDAGLREVIQSGKLGATYTMASVVTSDGDIVRCIKRAAADEGSVVVRCNECGACRPTSVYVDLSHITW